MRNVVRTACALAVMGITPAHAVDFLKDHIPGARTVGEGRLSFMMWDVYDAKLFAPNGTWQVNAPFALQLSYLRSIEGKKIADQSIKEIRAQGFKNERKLLQWYKKMVRIFPDVTQGTRLTGVFTNQGHTVFYNESKEIGRITDPEFSINFFGIWLSEKTSTPDLRKKLLGQV